MTSWGEMPGFRGEFDRPLSLPLFPTAYAAAVRSPFLNETQDFLYFILG